MKRVPIKEGTVIEVNQVKILVSELTGEGSTCLVYTGKILEEGAVLADTLVTIKEFYPADSNSEFGIRRLDSGELRFSDVSRDFAGFRARKEQFEAGYKVQKELANSDIMEITVKPFLYGTFGDSEYIVSDIHMGASLDRICPLSLAERLSCAIRVVELFAILHEAGYMMLDFKPDNILWISHPQMVKLIDADSVVRICPDDDEDVLTEKIQDNMGEEVLYINNRYGAPEILFLGEMLETGRCFLEEKRMSYLRPQANVYSLGLYLFELLFDRLPSEEDRRFTKELRGELFRKYEKEFCKESVVNELLTVIRDAIRPKPYQRITDAGVMMRALNQSIEKITFQKYIPKTNIAKANCTYLSYNMLEKYPLYDYARREDGRTILNVAVIGSHAFRESLLKTVIPCGQMLDSELNIHMFARDAEDFWEEYTSETCNPEARRTIQCYIDGKKMNEESEIIRAEIVDRPLAAFFLYSVMEPEAIGEILAKENISYIILAENDMGYNCRTADDLIKKLPRKKHLVAYLSEDNACEVRARNKVTVFPVVMEKISDGYNEAAYKSRVYNMGMNVHEFYYRGNHPRASLQEIRESYGKDVYNIESSERSALHTFYKLKSLGIDPKSPKAPYLFYEKVLSGNTEESRGLYDEIAALEHRSWTAFMVVNGVKAIDKLDEVFDGYAYDGDNDWKKKNSEGRVIIHPCMKYSRPGHRLDLAVWDARRRLTPKIQKGLDPLDLRSLEIYNAIEAVALRREDKIKDRLRELEAYFAESESEVVQSVLQSFLTAVRKVYDRETSSKNLWRQAVSDLRQAGGNEGVLRENALRTIADIEQLMRPALWIVEYKDFKYSDEDIVRAIPKLLIQNEHVQNINSRITIIKPIAKNAWQNLFSTIVVQPDLLVLVPCRDEDIAELKKYSLWLKKCNIDTRVWIKTVKQLREYGGKDGILFIDETGIDPDQSRMLTNNPFMKRAQTFKVDGRTLKPTDSNALITLFNRPVNLTVQETVMLHGSTVSSEKIPDYIAGLSVAEYKSIWNLYRELSNGKKWKVFIKELENLEESRNKDIILKKGVEGQHRSVYIEYDLLKRSGVKRVLEKLDRENIIFNLSMPAGGRYGKVTFTTGYQALASYLLEMIKILISHTDVHSYDVIIKEGSVSITDDTLYVSGVVPHTASKDVQNPAPYRDQVVREVCRLLDSKNKDKVLQNVRIDEATGNISFRYASGSVREVLRKEGSILEALIYLECKQKGIFDDIRVNVEIVWPDGETKNEVDVIGTKNSKTYFISAKMRAPEKGDVYEIRTICDKFAIEGEAVLVSSYFTTGKNERSGEDYESRPLALEERVKGMENMSYIGKDGVDISDPDGKCRKIVIASSIADIITE